MQTFRVGVFAVGRAGVDAVRGRGLWNRDLNMSWEVAVGELQLVQCEVGIRLYSSGTLSPRHRFASTRISAVLIGIHLFPKCKSQRMWRGGVKTGSKKRVERA